jgi:hypothetical protein
MAVSLTISKTLSGAQVADTLAGGSSGLDLGTCLDGEYAPIVSKSANTGWQNLFIRHNATIDPITNVVTFVAEMSGTYGGAQDAPTDFATLISKGAADSEVSANNSDGLSSGLRIEHDADIGGALGASAFLPSRAQVKIYGNNSTDGISLASAFDLHVDALVYDNSGTETDASSPQTGKIGKSGDSVLGDRAHIKLRWYLEEDAPDGGILQFDYVVGYAFTA